MFSDFSSSRADTNFSQAIQGIIDYIKRQGLKEDDPLPSADYFCDELNFSRVIIREAMSYLKGMGIISSGKGRGFKLAKIDPLGGIVNILPLFFSISRDRAELSRLRCNLELGAFPDVVANITQDKIQQLEDILAASTKLLQQEHFTNQDFITLDASFHNIICSVSGNRLLEIVSQCYFEEASDNPDRNDFVLPQNRESFIQSNLAHQVILDAIKAGDAEIGLLMLHKHMKTLRQKNYLK